MFFLVLIYSLYESFNLSMWDEQKAPKTQARFVVNKACTKPNLVTAKVLSFAHTYLLQQSCHC